MNKLACFFVFLFAISCSQKNKAENTETIPLVSTKYDTTAIDSFSVGASGVNIEQNIKFSSQSYVDSVKAVKVKLEEALLANEAKMKEEKLKADLEKSVKEKEGKEKGKEKEKVIKKESVIKENAESNTTPTNEPDLK